MENQKKEITFRMGFLREIYIVRKQVEHQIEVMEKQKEYLDFIGYKLDKVSKLIKETPVSMTELEDILSTINKEEEIIKMERQEQMKTLHDRQKLRRIAEIERGVNCSPDLTVSPMEIDNDTV
jgi:hypothetical protein